MNQDAVFQELPGRPLAYYTETLEKMGFDAQGIRRSVNISTRQLRSKAEPISTALTFALIEEAVEATRLPDLGLRIGRELTLADLGILGYAMASSNTLRDAVTMLGTYHEVVGGFLFPTLTESFGEACLTYRFHVPENEYSYFFMEEMLTGLLALTGELTGRRLCYHKVRLDYPRPANFRDYESMLRCPVSFSAGCNEVAMDRAFLDLPCLHRDPDTHAQCESVCRRLQQELRSVDNQLAGRVGKILCGCHGNLPDRDEVARQLNLSTRTLTRKLTETGTSYRRLVDRHRFELARTYLETTRFSVETISELVGYSDRSSFIRAFKRWSGKRPSEFRADPAHKAKLPV